MILRYSPTGIGPYGGDYPDERPRTRGECLTMPRPCPFVSCRHHLAIDAHRGLAGPRLRVLNEDPTTMANTCSLDVADGMAALPPLEQDHDVAAELSIGVVARLSGISWTRAHDTIRLVQRTMRNSLPQHVEDFELSDPEDKEPRTVSGKERAAAIMLEQLKQGPKALAELMATLREHGINRYQAKPGLKLLGSRVRSCGYRGGRNGKWSIVDGRQANLRHTGHPGKAGRSD